VTVGVHRRLLKWGEGDQASPEASQTGLCRVGSRARLHLKRGVEGGPSRKRPKEVRHVGAPGAERRGQGPQTGRSPVLLRGM